MTHVEIVVRHCEEFEEVRRERRGNPQPKSNKQGDFSRWSK